MMIRFITHLISCHEVRTIVIPTSRGISLINSANYVAFIVGRGHSVHTLIFIAVFDILLTLLGTHIRGWPCPSGAYLGLPTTPSGLGLWFLCLHWPGDISIESRSHLCQLREHHVWHPPFSAPRLAMAGTHGSALGWRILDEVSWTLSGPAILCLTLLQSKTETPNHV
jgi:hypothetical protein